MRTRPMRVMRDDVVHSLLRVSVRLDQMLFFYSCWLPSEDFIQL